MADDHAVAGRLKRPSWSDPRLLVGLLLIAIAVVAVGLTVKATDDSVSYYAARDTLTPGTVLSESSVDVAQGRVPGEAYVAVEGSEPWGMVVSRTVAAGELVPHGALVEAADADVRPIAVVTGVPLAEGIEPGSIVDVWVSKESDDERATVVIAEGLTVAAVDRGDGAFATREDTVHVAVPTADVGAFLGAVSGGGTIAVVGLGSR